MNIGSSSQNPRHATERNQVGLREGLESEESDARHSADDSTGNRRSRTGSRRLNQIQEAVFLQEATAQKSQDTLNNMTAMMQWQVNRQFRKDREAAMARIPNPDVIAGVQGHGEIRAGQRGGALPDQEHEGPIRPEGPTPVQVPQNQPEPPPIPQPVAPRNQPLALLPEAPDVITQNKISKK
ncbi:hypothetical protein L3X38_037093 [Prunus dulcis]|uniref:Uncharacterized protein n=1 Tax=Prunus dulcis TaxID=3755 RepID=A0AAD4V4I5_PRUDU|nr:hypothetical protein L3X38_037093 [Prunus dulcis]